MLGWYTVNDLLNERPYVLFQVGMRSLLRCHNDEEAIGRVVG